MVIQADAGLAQHAQKRLLGAEFRMVVAADIGHPARGLAQPPRLAGSRRETADRSRPAAPAAGSDRGPAAPPVRGRRPAAGPRSRIASRHPLHEPALAQAAGAEHHAAHAGRAQHAAQHHRGERQVVDAAARQRPAAAPARGGRRRRSRRSGRAPPRGRSCSGAPCAADSRSAPCGCAPAPAMRRRPDRDRGRRPRSATAPSRGRPRRSPARAPDRRPARSASRITPSCSVCDAPRAPRSSRTSSSEPPPISARMPSAVGNAAQHARRRSIPPPARPTGCGSARPACGACSPATKSAPLRASRTAAVASTSNGCARPSRARRRDSGASRSAPAPCPLRSAVRWPAGRGRGAAPPSR